jgi:hypothetical protein
MTKEIKGNNVEIGQVYQCGIGYLMVLQVTRCHQMSDYCEKQGIFRHCSQYRATVYAIKPGILKYDMCIGLLPMKYDGGFRFIC